VNRLSIGTLGSPLKWVQARWFAHHAPAAEHGGSAPTRIAPTPNLRGRDPKTLEKVADIKGVKTIKKGIVLKKLPTTGTYKISVVATTVLKQRLTGSQTYKACSKGSGKIKLKGGKKHHHA
jgi:hypothetical protein